jgi:superfamily II DNA or RNA helicase
MTRYTLGLSATMQRKDGLTKVFKMFLGDIVYSEERESTDTVLVKAIQYVTPDAEFNTMCYDYRGSPAYSTMISKLCAFNGRSEFILQF